MDDSREAFYKRREELQRLFREGGPRLEAYLREGAEEGIRSAYMAMDEAAQDVAKAIVEGHKAGMSGDEIQSLLDEEADEAESWPPRLPITVRMNVHHVHSIIDGAA